MIKRGKLSNRAISNVEMSIALILFVSTVFAIILMFNMFYKPVSRDYNLLDDFEKKFIAEGREYVMVGVNVSEGSPNCFNILFNDNLNKTDVNYLGVFHNDILMNKKVEEDNLIFENDGDGFYEVYNFSFSVVKKKNFVPNFPQFPCSGTNYVYSIPVEGKIFDSRDLSKMSNDYVLDYASLKEKFGVNFEIEFVGDAIPSVLDMKRGVPAGAEALAKALFIKFYDRDDEKIKDVQVNVRIWR